MNRVMESESRRPRRVPVSPDGGARRYLIAGLAVCAVVAVAGEPLRGWLLVVLIAAAVVAGVVALRREPDRDNPAWFLVVGAAFLVPAYVLWYPAKLHWDLELGDPAVTDWLFLAGYCSFIVAFARLIGRRSTDDRRIHVLDSLIISVGLGVLVWVLFISPYLHDDALGPLATAVAVSYTILDLLLFGGVVRLLVQGPVASTSDRLLTGWIATQLAGDLLYSAQSLQGTFELGGVPSVLYSVSFVLLGSALLHPATVHPPEPWTGDRPAPGVRRVFLLLPAALIAPVVLAVLGIKGDSTDVAAVALMAAILFGLVLLRVWLLMVDVEEHRRTQDRLRISIERERRRAQENHLLLASLRERQMLSDRLSRIQQKISRRAPLHDVLDAVTEGAAELLGEDVAALRLIDEDDPAMLIMVSSVGVPNADDEAVRRSSLGAGVGGRAAATNRLCVQDDYPDWDNALPSFANADLRTAMAVPVTLDGTPIGSLVVATHRAGRHYSDAEQDVLVAFADHVSLALNDARTVQAMNEALDTAVHQAMHDGLTGLPNRACFYDRTEQALRAGRRDGSQTAVLLFDLDRFKEINDTLGHRYGDRVLNAVGPRITSMLREADTLARLGGDEFCVLLPEVESVASAVGVAQRITEALEEPFEVDGMQVAVEASCGVAMAPGHGDTADLLLQRSDVAMYVSKNSHVRVVVYDDELDRNTPDRLALVGELRIAIPDEQLMLHFQPIADLRTGAICGVESLVRWEHPRRGLIGPETFIPIAEETGLVRPLTAWVLDAALDRMRSWIEDPSLHLSDDFTMSVNLSTQSLLDESFADEVIVALDRFGIPPRRLILEVTETTIMSDPIRSERVLTDLAAIGVRFAIDDFGTGYSSLAALKSLPVQDLKIDKSFVSHMHEDVNDALIVRSVIELGHTLGLRTVAEGVEDQRVWSQLSGLGCDAAQGYLLTPALPPAALVAWLRQRTVTGVRGMDAPVLS